MKTLIIAARPAAGFRRCGVFHPPQEVRHMPGRFTEEQVLALKAEPNLLVVEVEEEPEEVGAPEDGKAAGRKGDKPAA